MDAGGGAYMSLIVPLALLFVVLAWWGFAALRARRR